MKKVLLITAILATVSLVVLLVVSRQDEGSRPDSQENGQLSTGQETAGSKVSDGENRYVDFVSLDTSADSELQRVLFFKADWCITCNALDKNIRENTTAIPEDILIIRVDYDQETQLKQKYDVRQQHTLVQIDHEGEIVKKWSLSPSLEHILERVERT